MPLMICPKCKRFHYVPGDCPAPIRAEVRKGSPSRSEVGGRARTEAKKQDESLTTATADTRVPKPVNGEPRKPHRNADRHKPGYQAAKQHEYRQRRAKLKEEGKT